MVTRYAFQHRGVSKEPILSSSEKRGSQNVPFRVCRRKTEFADDFLLLLSFQNDGHGRLGALALEQAGVGETPARLSTY